MDPHSPALVETLLAADMFGVAPRDLLLVGVVGESYNSGCSLSDAVNASIPHAITEVLGEMKRLSVRYRVREDPADAGIWWTAIKQGALPLVSLSHRESQ
jgi:hypothetical protein